MPSQVWQFYHREYVANDSEEPHEKITCNQEGCETTYIRKKNNASTSNLLRHLRITHGITIGSETVPSSTPRKMDQPQASQIHKVALLENIQRMQRGELYTAFVPELIALRARCTQAVNRFNDTRETSRRHRVQLWRE